MDRFVAAANIKHYQRLIDKSTDPVERERLVKLLAEEETKLKAAEAAHTAEKRANQ
jgi:hypothetical protein